LNSYSTIDVNYEFNLQYDYELLLNYSFLFLKLKEERKGAPEKPTSTETILMIVSFKKNSYDSVTMYKESLLDMLVYIVL